MGEPLLILAFVVIVIGGIGSIRGAVIASVLIGIVEVVGRSILPFAMTSFMGSDAAQTAGPGNSLDADLCADGRRPVLQAGWAVPGAIGMRR